MASTSTSRVRAPFGIVHQDQSGAADHPDASCNACGSKVIDKLFECIDELARGELGHECYQRPVMHLPARRGPTKCRAERTPPASERARVL